MKNLISESRFWSQTRSFHTNSARRTCWNLSQSLLDCYVLRSLVSEIHKNIQLFVVITGNSPHPRIGQKTRVWELFLRILISESRSRAETRGSRTNSARRVHWDPFCAKVPPYLSETWFGILGIGAPLPPMVLLN